MNGYTLTGVTLTSVTPPTTDNSNVIIFDPPIEFSPFETTYYWPMTERCKNCGAEIPWYETNNDACIGCQVDYAMTPERLGSRLSAIEWVVLLGGAALIGLLIASIVRTLAAV